MVNENVFEADFDVLPLDCLVVSPSGSALPEQPKLLVLMNIATREIIGIRIASDVSEISVQEWILTRSRKDVKG